MFYRDGGVNFYGAINKELGVIQAYKSSVPRNRFDGLDLDSGGQRNSYKIVGCYIIDISYWNFVLNLR